MQKIKFRLPQGIGDANKGDATAEEWEKRLKETYGSENVERVESPYHENADATIEDLGKNANDVTAYQKYKQSLVKGDVLENSEVIITGDKFGDQKLISELTKDGSAISDWAKMESNYKYTTEYGTGKIHYYKNMQTGEVSYYDAKMKIPTPKDLKGNLSNTITDKDGFWIIDLDENLIPKEVRK